MTDSQLILLSGFSVLCSPQAKNLNSGIFEVFHSLSSVVPVDNDPDLHPLKSLFYVYLRLDYIAGRVHNVGSTLNEQSNWGCRNFIN